MLRMGKTGKGLIKCLGPILFLVLALRAVDTRAAWELLRGVRWDLSVLSLLFFPWLTWVHALRWWMVGRLVGMNSTLKRLFQVYYAGWFLGFLPPGGVALLAKILYLKRDGEPVGRTSVSLGVDKLFDLISTAVFAMYGLFYFQGRILRGEGMWLGLAACALISVILLLKGKWFWDKARDTVDNYVGRLGTKARDLFLQSDEAVGTLWERMRPWDFMRLAAVSLCLELSRATVFFVLAKALGLDISVPFAFACRALIGVVQLAPVTVGGLGTREAVLILTFPLAGLSREAAVALGFLSFLWNMIFHLSGVASWLREPISYKRGMRTQNGG